MGSITFRHFLCGLILFSAASLAADPVPVRYLEGTEHGFLVLRSLGGKTLASGDLIQVLHGDQLTARLVFHFRDGSIDEETSVFTQRTYFRLISDHHIQKGPAYAHPADISINTETGQVTSRFSDNGHEKIETVHMELPNDLANGIILNMLKNVDPKAPVTKVSYVAATPKPRLVKLTIIPQGEEQFSVAGARHNAVRFSAKVDLGGVEGVIAPLVGKEPPPIQVWVMGGEAPAFVKSAGPLYLGGPIWTIEMTSPVWRNAAKSGY